MVDHPSSLFDLNRFLVLVKRSSSELSTYRCGLTTLFIEVNAYFEPRDLVTKGVCFLPDIAANGLNQSGFPEGQKARSRDSPCPWAVDPNSSYIVSGFYGRVVYEIGEHTAPIYRFLPMVFREMGKNINLYKINKRSFNRGLEGGKYGNKHNNKTL